MVKMAFDQEPMVSKQHDHDEHIKEGKMLVKLSVEFSEPN